MTQNTRNAYRLLGLAKCLHCGEAMTASHDPELSYICPTRQKTGPDDCPTPPIGALYLDRLVTTHLVASTLTSQNLETVVDIVQEESRKETLEHPRELEGIRGQLTEQERARRGLLTAVEHERATFAQASGQLEELNEAKTALGTQADRERTGLDIQEVLSDERRIRANILNPDTYLESRDQETVRDMLRIFVAEVLVGEGSATISYTIPLPQPGDATRAYTHELPLA